MFWQCLMECFQETWLLITVFVGLFIYSKFFDKSEDEEGQ